MLDVSRVQKELTECNKDREVSGVSIELYEGGADGRGSLSHLRGTISGPITTPYEGGTFKINIHLPGIDSHLEAPRQFAAVGRVDRVLEPPILFLFPLHNFLQCGPASPWNVLGSW